MLLWVGIVVRQWNVGVNLASPVVAGEAQLTIPSKYDHYDVCLVDTWKACYFMDK